MEERLQKLLAQAGYGSRRTCEVFITEGRVRVNGKVAELGQKADLMVDKILVDGKALAMPESFTYIALYKPRNVLSAAEGQDGRETVRDLIPLPGHLYPVGRLDFDSEGLILMTNDGELTNKLTHPKYGHLKEYRVLLARRPDHKQLETWRRGVVLEDGDKTAPAEVHSIGMAGKGAWVRVIMGEGKKRQIREVGKILGLPVVKIIRLRIGTLRLGNLKPRQWRHLSPDEVAELRGESAGASSERSNTGRQTAGRTSLSKRRPATQNRGKTPSQGRPTGKPAPERRKNSSNPPRTNRPRSGSK